MADTHPLRDRPILAHLAEHGADLELLHRSLAVRDAASFAGHVEALRARPDSRR